MQEKEAQNEKTYAEEAMREKLWVSESHVSMVRLLILVCCSVIYHTILSDSLKIPWLATLTMLLSFPFSVVMVVFKPYKKYPLFLSRFVSVFSDALFIILWIYATGGTDSPFHSLWFLSIIAVAQRFTFIETFLVSIFYALVYFVIIISNPVHEVATTNLITRLLFIPLTGILGAYFSREIEDQIQDKLRLRESELKIKQILNDLQYQIEKKNEAEYELKKIQVELEKKVEDRTNDYRILTEQLKKIIREKEKIQKVQEETLHRLEITNKELENFAYVTSHDLKAPLRGIATIADWLVHDYANKLDSEGLENLKMLKQRAKKMNDLIEGILQYSRIGRVDTKAELVYPAELLREVKVLLSPPDTISFLISDEFPVLEINKVLLFRVFENLLGNAIKHTGKSGGLIIIESIQKTDEWVFFVTDTGPGIDPKYHQKIFEMFQTLRNENDPENTGMGLAIVKKIINGFGGRVWVESETGKGSTFYFTVPKSMIKEHEYSNAG